MKNLTRYAVRASALLLVGLLTPIASHAFLITNTTAVGSEFTVSYLLEDGASDGNGNLNTLGQDIKAEVVFMFKGLGTENGNNWVWLGVTAENTSVLLVPANEVGIWQLAFGTSPSATGVKFDQVDLGGNDANKFLGAAYDDGQPPPEIVPALTLGGTLTLNVATNTNPGAAGRLLEGQWDYFELKLLFNEIPTEGVSFTPFSSFWQSSGPSGSEGPSFQFAGNGNGDDDEPPAQIPEPATVVLLGAGLLGLAGIRRRFRG